MRARFRLQGPEETPCLWATMDFTSKTPFVPAPAAHAVLQIPVVGDCVFDGVVIEPAGLPGALETLHAQAPSLLLEIHASRQASSASVHTAVSAARRAHVRVAFTAGSPAP